MARHRERGIPDIGDRINAFRGDKEISTLSAESGISVSYLSRLIQGGVPNPTIDFVVRLSGALGITVSEFIGETPSRRTSSLGDSEDLVTIIAEYAQQVIPTLTNINYIPNNPDGRDGAIIAYLPHEENQVPLVIGAIAPDGKPYTTLSPLPPMRRLLPPPPTKKD